jgi:hypothetical protein
MYEPDIKRSLVVLTQITTTLETTQFDYTFWSRKFALQYAHKQSCYRSEYRYMRQLATTITVTQLVSVATAFRQWRYCRYYRLQEIYNLTFCISSMTQL